MSPKQSKPRRLILNRESLRAINPDSTVQTMVPGGSGPPECGTCITICVSIDTCRY